MKIIFFNAIATMYVIIALLTIFFGVYNAHKAAVVQRDNERLYRDKEALKSHIWGDSVMHKLKGEYLKGDGIYINDTSSPSVFDDMNGEYYKIDNGPWIKKGGMIIHGDGYIVDSIRHQLKHK